MLSYMKKGRRRLCVRLSPTSLQQKRTAARPVYDFEIFTELGRKVGVPQRIVYQSAKDIPPHYYQDRLGAEPPTSARLNLSFRVRLQNFY